MLLNTLQHARQPPDEHYLLPNVSSANAERPELDHGLARPQGSRFHHVCLLTLSLCIHMTFLSVQERSMIVTSFTQRRDQWTEWTKISCANKSHRNNKYITVGKSHHSRNIAAQEVSWWPRAPSSEPSCLPNSLNLQREKSEVYCHFEKLH